MRDFEGVVIWENNQFVVWCKDSLINSKLILYPLYVAYPVCFIHFIPNQFTKFIVNGSIHHHFLSIYSYLHKRKVHSWVIVRNPSYFYLDTSLPLFLISFIHTDTHFIHTHIHTLLLQFLSLGFKPFPH